MEYLPQILQTAFELGFTPLNIFLACMLYFMGAHSGIFPKFWGNETQASNQPATREQMEKLSSYYNHDTTEILKDIRQHLSDVKEETKTINNNLASLAVTTNRLETTIREWEKYGVPSGNNK